VSGSSTSPQATRSPPGRRVLADPTVDGLADQVGLAGVAAVLLEHVVGEPGLADRPAPLLGDLAFVGLSKIRETGIFGGAPIAAYHDQLKCGVGVIELSTGNTLATLQFANGVEEIFDVQVLPGTRCPSLGGPSEDGGACWVLPHR
jgi:uncharacterized protein (TIGR03032 family)